MAGCAGAEFDLKKFRRHFVPFSEEELQKPQWEEVRGSFEHLVEICVALKMTADGIAFRHVTSLLTEDRSKLRSAYRRAYYEANSGQGASLVVRANDGRTTTISGLYLDFSAVVNLGRTLSTTGPILLDPWEALERYMGFYRGLHLSRRFA